MAAPHVSGTVALMLSNLLSTKYNIDSTVGLNKAIKTAIQQSATPLKSAGDAAKVPGGFLSAPAAITSLRTGGFLPPSASSFPIYVIVALVGVVIGMILMCVIGLFVRTLWEGRQSRKAKVEDRRRLLEETRSHQAAAKGVARGPQGRKPPSRASGPPQSPEPAKSLLKPSPLTESLPAGRSRSGFIRDGYLPVSTPLSLSRLNIPTPQQREDPIVLPSSPYDGRVESRGLLSPFSRREQSAHRGDLHPALSSPYQEDLSTNPLSHRLSDSNMSDASVASLM